MGLNLFCTGLTCIELTRNNVIAIPAGVTVGGVLMAFGVVLMWFGR